MKTKKIITILTMFFIMGLLFATPVWAGTCRDGSSDFQCCSVTNPAANNASQSLLAVLEGYNYGTGENENQNWAECQDEWNFRGFEEASVAQTLELKSNVSEGELEINGNDKLIKSLISDHDAPIFRINGKRKVTIRDLTVSANGYANPFIRCTKASSLTLENITIQNLPSRAIMIEGCSNVKINGLYIEGSADLTGSGAEEPILISITPKLDESSGSVIGADISNIDINDVRLEQGVSGTGIYIAHATGISLTAIEASNLDGAVVKLDDISGLEALEVTGNKVRTGVYLNNVFGGADGASLPHIKLSLTGDPDVATADEYDGVGLYLDNNIVGMKFDHVLIQNFAGNGITVRDDSNYNTFSGIEVYNNGGYGIAFEDSAKGNKIEKSTFYSNADCGIYLGSKEKNMLVGDRNQMPNNGSSGNGCAIDGVDLDIEDGAVKVFPYNREKYIVVDLDRDALFGEKTLDLHRLNSKTGNTAFSGQESLIESFDTAALPADTTVDTTEIVFAVIVKDESDNVIGIVKELTASTEASNSTDPNCYDNPNGSGFFRIYDPVNPKDTDKDGLGDHEEDADGDCVVDKGETDPYNDDTDGDGLSDYWELVWGTDPNEQDSDDDGLLDGDEDVNNNGIVDTADGETNPTKADTDGDGLSDNMEKQLGTDPNDSDSDGDGEMDGEDDCPLTSGDDKCYYKRCVPGVIPTTNIDNDDDGVMDYFEDANQNCEWDPGETRPDKPDTDGDGIPDGIEDYNQDGKRDEGESDPTNTDTDGDCILDGDEDKNGDGIFSLEDGETSPIETDSDGDGIADGDEDFDCDGVNDAGETKPWLADTDGDGTDDASDICPWSINASCVVRYCGINGFDDYDADGDGLPDKDEDFNGDCAWTESELEPNPLVPDTDGDGLSDSIEVDCYDTNPLAEDTDGDGRTDAEEVANASANNSCAVWSFAGDTDPRTRNVNCSLNTDPEGKGEGSLPLALLALAALGLVLRFSKRNTLAKRA